MKDTNIYHGDTTQTNPFTHKDYNDYLKNTERRQELPGFDEEYLDIVDYILKITHRIWEERGIGIIYDTYHNDCLVHAGDSTSSGVSGVVAGTLANLYSFPDRRLIGEDVIWSEDKPGMFFSSHRNLSIATNLHDSPFGPATGKRAVYRNIADCAMTENRIYEEWLTRDNLALVTQLGFDPHEVAKKLARSGKVKDAPKGFPEAMEGQLYPATYKAKDDSAGERTLEMHQGIFGCKRLDLVRTFFADNAAVHYINNQELVGHEEIMGAFIGLLSSFPSAQHVVDRVTCNAYENGETHVAVRWRLRGLHEGLGFFGAPSGNPVELLAVSHYVVNHGKITEAFIVFDAIDVLRQIYLGRVEQEPTME